MGAERMVERTVSQWLDGQWASEGQKLSVREQAELELQYLRGHRTLRGKQLSDFRDARAFVLLGEPGSGKSTEFRREAESDENCTLVTARQFINRSLDAHPEWRGQTLFIDGLDEVRAGGGDPREALNKLTNRLERLGNPQFRLSCREDAWLGNSDIGELSSLVDGEDLHLLRLDPLTRRDTFHILEAAQVAEPGRLMRDARQRGLEAFLQNPLLLGLLTKARREQSPLGGFGSRLDTFENACEALAKETNREHLVARPHAATFATDEVVLAAGRLCAILLLCDKSGWSQHGHDDEYYPAISDAGEQQPLLKFALDTGLFVGSAETGRRPRHRQIAEFLAAKHLDHAIREDGLSSTRVLAWMRGVDGIVLPSLRGLSVWLASMNAEVRRPLIETDPIGIACQGDAGRFSRADTELLLEGLERQLGHQSLTNRRDSWSSASLGALMAGPARDLLWDLLREENRPSSSRQLLVDALLRGLIAAPAGADANVPEVPSAWWPVTDPSGRNASADAFPGVASPALLVNARVILPGVIRDAVWSSDVRLLALRALIHLIGEGKDGPATVEALLQDIDEGRVPEDEHGKLHDALRGRILTCLYPRHFPADQLWDYAERKWFHRGSSQEAGGTGHEPAPSATSLPHPQVLDFWTRHVVEESAPEDVRTLVDALAERAGQLIPLLARHDVESVVLHLLVRGLELFGEEMEIPQLHRWFDLVESSGRDRLIPAHCRNQGLPPHALADKVYAWLRDHTDIQLALVLESLKRIVPRPDGLRHMRDVGAKFLGDRVPPHFRRWCLDNAVALVPTNPREAGYPVGGEWVAKELLYWAVTPWLNDWPPPLSIEEARAVVGHVPSLRQRLGEIARERIAHARDDAEYEAELRASQPYIEARKRLRDYIAVIREHRRDIAAGIGPPAILHRLGGVYLSGFRQDGVDIQGRRRGGVDQARSDLESHLNDDKELRDVAIRGFLAVSRRSDLPDLAEIARLRERGLDSHFRPPFVAGLIEDERAGADPLQHLDIDGLIRAAGFYLLSLLPRRRGSPQGPAKAWMERDARPRWYCRALGARPEAVAKAFVAVNRARVRAKEFPEPHLRDMATRPEYESVAKLAVPKMFVAFPTCCTEVQNQSLSLVVAAGLKHIHHAELEAVIRRRLRRKKMDPMQRATWLAVGLFVDREAYVPRVVDFMAGRKEIVRIGHLADFLVGQGGPMRAREWAAEWTAADLATLIKAAGSRLPRPWDTDAATPMVIDAPAGHMITAWVNALAERTHDAALSALDDLIADPALKSWRGDLAGARDEQAKMRRMSAFNPPTVREMRKALRGGPPAGPADLAALVSEELEMAGERIRHENTDGWEFFWRKDPNDTKSRVPDLENRCRNLLLIYLKPRLERRDIIVQPEAYHAESKRSDILAIHGTHAVPIEVKRSDSDELWKAIPNQLVAKYTRDPNSGGYGIFAVLWFGPDHQKPPPSGSKPRSPAQLKSALESALEESLTPEQRRTVSVIVIDVSKPTGTPPP